MVGVEKLMRNDLDVTKKVIFEKLYSIKPEAGDGEAELKGQEELLSEINCNLNKLVELHRITSVKELVSKHTGLLRKVLIFCKKIIRKSVYWYIEPICFDQSSYNELNVKTMKQLLVLAQKEKTSVTESDETLCRILDTERELLDLKKAMVESEYGRKRLRLSVDELKRHVEGIKQEQSKYSYMADEIKEATDDLQIIKTTNSHLFEKDEKNFWDKRSVAQSGEDMILSYIFNTLMIDVKNEYYLDLGANHAKQFSNTYMLYQAGMRGVLVEANPDFMGELKFIRSEDVILNKCISDVSGKKVKFYVLNGDGLSTSDIEAVNAVIKVNPYIHIKEEIEVDTITVNDIFEKYFDRAPLLISVDIEGYEEKILASIDYNRFAPLIIVVERIDYGLSIATQKRDDRIPDIMEKNGYFEYAFTGINSIYINKKRLEEIRGEYCV